MSVWRELGVIVTAERRLSVWLLVATRVQPVLKSLLLRYAHDPLPNSAKNKP